MPDQQSKRQHPAGRGLERTALEAGIDPRCTLWRSNPMHTCSDRDGNPITTSGKCCWASARMDAITEETLAQAIMDDPFIGPKDVA